MTQICSVHLVAKLCKSKKATLANQSLKLTEGAVDDFARAKQLATIGHDLARADWIPSLRHFAAAA